MSRIRRDGYTEIGTKCEPFESQLDIDEVNKLRDFVLRDYFLKVPNLHIRHEETYGKVSHAKLFPNYSVDYDTPSVFGSALLKNLDSDSWRMIIMQTRTRRSSENTTQQRIVSRMNVEVLDDRVVEAVKKVQIVRGLGELTVESIERQMEEEGEEAAFYVERKAYERYMTVDDCDKATEFLGRITRRIVATGR